MPPNSRDRVVRLSDIQPPSRTLAQWERQKRKASLLVQCVAEAAGTFIYTYAGTASTAAYVLGNDLGAVNLGSLFQIGVAYAVGIALAVIICVPTSGGTLNPGFTIFAMVAGKCGVKKGCAFIVAQIIGSFLACLMVYVQWHNDFTVVIAGLKAQDLYDSVMYTSNGPAGILAFYVPPGINLGYVFVNELMVDFVLALVIIGSTDPTNPACTAAVMPWLYGLTYGVVVWGFAGPGLATNTARDVGGRLAALCIWGIPASGGRYAAISALTSIPASILGGFFYFFVLADHSRPVTDENVRHLEMKNAAAESTMTLDGHDAPGSPGSLRENDFEKA